MEWDSFDYKIAGHYLPALINGDESGLSDEESEDLRHFEESAQSAARDAGFTVWHWSYEGDYSEDFGRCEVSGLFANRQAVKLMVCRA